jgi:Lrp/AsnC family transcriptional regulator for asnA, asnC and gidA
MRVRGSVDAAAESLLKHPEFSYVVGCFGEDDLVAYGVAENGVALNNLLDRSVRGNPLLYRVRSETVLSFAGAERATGAAPLPRTIDRTDRLIIREVQRDGRISFTDIAQRTGISATSAADRFRRLLSDGTVRILTLPDPPRVDLNLSGLMQFHLSQPISAVLPKLAAFTELAFLSACTGRVSVQCEFNVRDEAHFDELRGKLLAVSGVDYVGVNILRRIYRQSFEWGAIPAE